MDIESILSNYDENKHKYESIEETIRENIKGRICHHRVVILNLIQEFIDVNTYLEIGVHNGASMSYVVSHPSKKECIGIDIFSRVGLYKMDNLSYERSLDNIQRNNTGGSNIHLIKGDSFETETKRKVQSILGDNIVDLLFIDASHEYEGIKNDFEKYEDLVRTNGVIVLDDYNKKHPGIVKYVNECIKNSDKYKIIGVFMGRILIIQKR